MFVFLQPPGILPQNDQEGLHVVSSELPAGSTLPGPGTNSVDEKSTIFHFSYFRSQLLSDSSVFAKQHVILYWKPLALLT